MLGGAWLLLTFGLLLAAGVAGETPLYLAALLVFFTGGIARLWARHIFTRLELSLRLSAPRVFTGDPVYLEVTATNAKLLPLPWLRVEVEVPEETVFAEGLTTPASAPRRRLLAFGMSVGAYQRVTRRYPFQCTRRGFFSFGPVRLTAGDLFGFFHREIVVPREDPIIVYPRVLPLDRLGIPSKELFGDVRVRRHLFEDPVRVMTTREYAPGDPLRRVHWKTSARRGQLYTKVFEPTTSVEAALFLDSRTLPAPIWGFIEGLLELGVLTAAAIAGHAHQQDIRAGLYVNQSNRRSDRMIEIPPSSHPDQLLHILGALAQVHPHELFSIDRLVERHARSLPWHATIVVVTAAPTDDLLATLVRQRRAGRRVALVVPGGLPRGRSPSGIPTFAVGDPDTWETQEAVAIEEVG